MPIKIRDDIPDKNSPDNVESVPEFELVTDVKPDPEPEHTTPQGRKTRKSAPSSPVRRGPVTATTRKDIHAKVSMLLLPAGAVWQTRDPECGSSFVNNTPDIADAMTDIIVDSPDLVRWFTGTGGSFMKYFKLLMALQPVAMTVVQHHVMHKKSEEINQDAPVDANSDWTGYDIPTV